MPKISLLRVITVLSIGYLGCIDPVEPEFRFRAGLIYIDALASTIPKASYVTISETKREFGIANVTPVEGAEVYFINSDTGARIELTETEGAYFPPDEFKLVVGQIWELEVVLENGAMYKSQAEKVQPEVKTQSIEVDYTPELLYSETYDAFVPSHEIKATFENPQNQENYYYWRYKSYEKLVYCRECYNYTVLRNEVCFQPNPNGGGPPLKEYYTYACESDCWRVRSNEEIEVFSDEFVNGKTVSQLPIGGVILYTNDNILIELQQFSISREAYRYFKTLKDLVDDNGGFNAPLPAALVGNMYKVNEPEEYVLGRFTAASTSVTSKFVERISIEEPQLEQRIINSPEEDEAPAPIVTKAPCVEGRFRTSIRPNGWVD